MRGDGLCERVDPTLHFRGLSPTARWFLPSCTEWSFSGPFGSRACTILGVILGSVRESFWGQFGSCAGTRIRTRTPTRIRTQTRTRTRIRARTRTRTRNSSSSLNSSSNSNSNSMSPRTGTGTGIGLRPAVCRQTETAPALRASAVSVCLQGTDDFPARDTGRSRDIGRSQDTGRKVAAPSGDF